MVLAAVAVVVLAAAGLGVYLLDGGDGGSGGASCLARAAAHIPSVDDEAAPFVSRMVSGGDLERARAAGFDDSGSFRDLAASSMETGVFPDPLYTLALVRANEDIAPPETAGYDSSQVSCWMGLDAGEASAAVGDFDEAAVASSERGEAGEVATNGGLLTYDGHGGAATRLDQEEAVGGDLAVFLDELDDHEAVSFTILDLGDDDRESPPTPPVAVGTAHDDAWELLIVWLLPDADTAGEAYDAIISLASGDETGVPDIVSGDPIDHLDQNGTLVTLRAPLDVPTGWQSLASTVNPILFPLQE